MAMLNNQRVSIIDSLLWEDPPFSIGQSTISMAISNSYVSHYQRLSASLYKLLLVGGAITILKNMSSSMGRMTSHI
jgi:hypothetical protein